MNYVWNMCAALKLEIISCMRFLSFLLYHVCVCVRCAYKWIFLTVWFLYDFIAILNCKLRANEIIRIWWILYLTCEQIDTRFSAIFFLSWNWAYFIWRNWNHLEFGRFEFWSHWSDTLVSCNMESIPLSAHTYIKHHTVSYIDMVHC